MPPKWVDDLKRVGWQPALDFPVAFSVAADDEVRETRSELREALYEALALISGGYNPSRIRVTADTPSGLSVEVVSDFRIIGMAIGALEDEPITVIEGPSWLPPYPPGEDPRRARRRVRRRRP
jgi:hypothetical protein